MNHDGKAFCNQLAHRVADVVCRIEEDAAGEVAAVLQDALDALAKIEAGHRCWIELWMQHDLQRL